MGEILMEHNWDNDDLLGEEHEDAKLHSFVNVQKNEPINVINASTFANNQSVIVPNSGAYVYVAPATPYVVSSVKQVHAEQESATGAAATLATAALGHSSARSKTTGTASAVTNLLSNAGGARPVRPRSADAQQPLARQHLDTSPMPLSDYAPSAGGSDQAPSSLGGLLDSLIAAGVAADGSSNVKTGSEAAVALLCSSPTSGTVLRCSKRAAAMTDLDTMEKVSKVAAIRNLDKTCESSKPSPLSVTRIKRNLASVGVSFGKSEGSVLFAAEKLNL